MILLTLLHILESIGDVSEDVNELKDVTKDLTGKVEESLGEHIRVLFRFGEIRLVNYQENIDHIGDVT